MKVVTFIFVCLCMALNLTACTEVNKNSAAAAAPKLRDAVKKKRLFHGDMETAAPAVMDKIIAEALKERKLSVDSSRTIGEAFDSYTFAAKTDWRETHTRVDPYFVDCIYWFPVNPLSLEAFREGLVDRKLEVKFAVYEDGESYISLVSRIDTKTDGMIHYHRYSPVEMKNIVSAIYENREITF